MRYFPAPLTLAITLYALLFSPVAQAENQYITDSITINLRSNPVNDAKIIGKALTSGNPVEVLQRSPNGKWARVRFQQMEGWLPAEFLQKEQAASDRLLELQERFNALSHGSGNETVQSKNMEIELQTLRTSLQQLQRERDAALRQLVDLKMTSAGPSELAAAKTALEAKRTQLSIDNERLAVEVARLNDSERSDFLFYGGLIVFGGMIAGWLMARLSGRRPSNW